MTPEALAALLAALGIPGLAGVTWKLGSAALELFRQLVGSLTRIEEHGKQTTDAVKEMSVRLEHRLENVEKAVADMLVLPLTREQLQALQLIQETQQEALRRRPGGSEL